MLSVRSPRFFSNLFKPPSADPLLDTGSQESARTRRSRRKQSLALFQGNSEDLFVLRDVDFVLTS